MWVHVHPDGKIFIRNGKEPIVYGDFAEVESLIGKQIDLPYGCFGREYHPDQNLVIDYMRHGHEPKRESWADGDLILSKCEEWVGIKEEARIRKIKAIEDMEKENLRLSHEHDKIVEDHRKENEKILKEIEKHRAENEKILKPKDDPSEPEWNDLSALERIKKAIIG